MLNTSLITLSFSDDSKQALKHVINLSMFEYNLDVTHTKASDYNIYKHSPSQLSQHYFCFHTWQALAS